MAIWISITGMSVQIANASNQKQSRKVVVISFIFPHSFLANIHKIWYNKTSKGRPKPPSTGGLDSQLLWTVFAIPGYFSNQAHEFYEPLAQSVQNYQQSQ